MADSIQFTCPECGKQMDLPAETAGQQGVCPDCKQVVTIQPDPPPPLDLESLLIPAPATSAPVPLAPPVVAPQIVQPQIVQPQIVQPGELALPMASSGASASGEKKRFIYMAAGAGGLLLLLVIALLFTGGESGSADAFGRRALAAIQAKDPEQLCELFVEHEDFQWMFERIRSAIDDPLKKIRFEEGQDFPDEESMTRWNDKWRKGVIRFLTRIESGEADLTFEQLENATYLGLLGEVPRRTFEEETGVSYEDVGVITIEEPEIYIGVQGRVFVIEFNEVLVYLNGHWRVSGDLGPRLSFAFDQPIDLEQVRFELVAPGGREVLERVNRYLRDSQRVRQEQGNGVSTDTNVTSRHPTTRYHRLQHAQWMLSVLKRHHHSPSLPL